MIGCFPVPYPDEPVYSMVARYDDRVSYPRKRSVPAEVFGDQNVMAVIDLPSHLDHLLRQLPNSYGRTIDQIIDCHTLLPFYAPFLPVDRVSQLRRDMRGTNGPAIHMRAGIMASRVVLPMYLRYCPKCVESDRQQYGETYWHRIHQLPAVPICPVHGADLLDSPIKARGGSMRYSYHSAQRALPNACTPTFSSAAAHMIVTQVAEDAQWLLEHPSVMPGPDFMRGEYLSLLASRGLATRSGHVRIRDLDREFSSFCPAPILNLLQCGMPQENAETWLMRLLRSKRSAHHPIRHLLFLRFLGYSPAQFVQNLDGVAHVHPFGDAPWPCLNVCSDHHLQPVITICELTQTEERIARPVGKFYCACGFAFSRVGPDGFDGDKYRFDKVISFGETWEEHLVELWQDPRKSLRAIARELKVDPATVKKRALKLGLPHTRGTTGHLVTAKSSTCREHMSGAEPPGEMMKPLYREQWAAYIASKPTKSVTEIRSVAPSVYAWLYRHDRAWLKANSPKLGRDSAIRGSRVDWAERDRMISEGIATAAQRLIQRTSRPVRLTATALGREAGHSSIIAQHIEKLPATKEMLQKWIETREAYATRRIVWVANQCQSEGTNISRWQLIRLAGVDRLKSDPSVKSALSTALHSFAKAVP